MTSQTLLQAACDTPDDWLHLQKLLLQHDEESLPATLEKLFEQVDQSDFSLSDWIQALLLFDHWLDEKNIPLRPLDSMIDYIHCCTLTLSDNLAPPDLAVLTEKMLTQYGFDKTNESKA